MRVLIRSWIACAAVAWSGTALAQPAPRAPRPAAAPAAPGAPGAPGAAAAKLLADAQRQFDRGDYAQARALAEQGLAAEPAGDARWKLHRVHGNVLEKLREYDGAVAAYQACLAAGVAGKQRRLVEDAIADLQKTIAVLKTTSLEVTVSRGPAEVYVDTKTQGLFCQAAPACARPIVPDTYEVIVERPGYRRWKQPVTVKEGEVARVSVTLVDLPSRLTVRAPEGAAITVGGAPYTPGQELAGGEHGIEVTLEGYKRFSQQVTAAEGKPIELEARLARLVPLRVSPAGAAVTIDGAPAELDGDRVAVPPGAKQVVARAPGHRDRTVALPAELTAEYTLAVELERLPPPAPPGPAGLWSTRRYIAVGAAVAAVAAGGVGVALGVRSGQLEDDAFALCPSPDVGCADAARATDLNSQARSRARQANLAFGAAGVAAIGAAILWFTGAPSRGDAAEPRIAVTPHLGGGAGLDVAVRF